MGVCQRTAGSVHDFCAGAQADDRADGAVALAAIPGHGGGAGGGCRDGSGAAGAD